MQPAERQVAHRRGVTAALPVSAGRKTRYTRTNNSFASSLESPR